MYKVKNISSSERKFRDTYIGKDIIILPGEHVLTNRPPLASVIWEIKKTENKTMVIKKIKKKKTRNKKPYIEKTEQRTELNDKEVKTWQQ